jgi:hypothetical protein
VTEQPFVIDMRQIQLSHPIDADIKRLYLKMSIAASCKVGVSVAVNVAA